MANIIPLFASVAYDDEDVAALGFAYDLTQETLQKLHLTQFEDEAVAKAILAVAETGERNGEHLCLGALKLLGLTDRSERKA